MQCTLHVNCGIRSNYDLLCLLLLGFIINVFSASGAFSQSPPPGTDTLQVNALHAEAVGYFEKGDYPHAMETAREIIRQANQIGYHRGKAMAWNLTGQVNIRMSLYDSAIRHFEKSLALFEQVGYAPGVASSHLYIGQAYDYLGQYSNSLRHLEKALKHITVQQDTLLYTKIKNSIGVTSFNAGDYESAIKNYVEGMQLLADRHDPVSNKHYAGLLNNIGAVYQQMGQYDMAIEYFQRLNATAIKLQHKYLIAVSLLNLGEVHKWKQNYASAQLYLNQALMHYEELQDHRGMALVYSNLGDVHKRQNRVREAEQCYLKATTNSELTKNNDLVIRSLLGLSDLYVAARRFDQSARLLRKSFDIAEKIQSRPSLEQAYLIQSRLDSARGNYQEAYTWHKKYTQLKDALLNERNSKQIIQMRELYENERKEKEIIRLNEAQQIERIKNDSDKNLLKSLIVCAVLIIVFLVSNAYLKNRHARQLKDERDKVTRMNDELNELVKKIERQKKKLSVKNNKLEELYRENSGLISVVAHDLRSPLNSIAGLSSLFPLVGPVTPEQKDVLKRIARICENSNNLIADLLELSQHETTSELKIKQVDSGPFIRELIENYSDRLQKKSLRLICDIPHGQSLTLETDQLYLTRILDNLITNAIKFSPPEKIIIVTIRNISWNQTLEFTVQDEGPGFSSDDMAHLFKKFKKLSARPTAGEHSSGLGLSIVKVLAEKLHGVVSVKNALPTGASITIALPIQFIREQNSTQKPEEAVEVMA